MKNVVCLLLQVLSGSPGYHGDHVPPLLWPLGCSSPRGVLTHRFAPSCGRGFSKSPSP